MHVTFFSGAWETTNRSTCIEDPAVSLRPGRVPVPAQALDLPGSVPELTDERPCPIIHTTQYEDSTAGQTSKAPSPPHTCNYRVVNFHSSLQKANHIKPFGFVPWQQITWAFDFKALCLINSWHNFCFSTERCFWEESSSMTTRPHSCLRKKRGGEGGMGMCEAEGRLFMHCVNILDKPGCTDILT